MGMTINLSYKGKMNSLLDSIYSRIANRDLFFQSGWGDKDGLRYIIENHPTNIHLRPVKDIELKITKEQEKKISQ